MQDKVNNQDLSMIALSLNILMKLDKILMIAITKVEFNLPSIKKVICKSHVSNLGDSM